MPGLKCGKISLLLLTERLLLDVFIVSGRFDILPGFTGVCMLLDQCIGNVVVLDRGRAGVDSFVLRLMSATFEIVRHLNV